MTQLTEFKQWENNISRVRLPKWKELPTLGLYVDQVAAVINEQLANLGMEPLTKSMINNYVKKKVIQAPVKKKYAVNQIVDLLLIGLLKHNFSIDKIRASIAQITANSYPQAAYDRFVDIMNASLSGQAIPANDELDSNKDHLMQLAVETVVASLKASHLLLALSREETTVTPKHV
ncbi:DUF1836 domain-containing protein [Limosilactobacillus frumenti]|uniref:DUF1836 domain-containing protein n=1 Tax=Limosilactobacillus frumenti TaxID=104955 RepID=UPI0015EC2560|nr:DUF1836 domain-containing protein [Limosilactobacillus frumenti]MBA2913912.1 DUF1836 domain-containing protein [Limosilactobacillus frumenti]